MLNILIDLLYPLSLMLNLLNSPIIMLLYPSAVYIIIYISINFILYVFKLYID